MRKISFIFCLLLSAFILAQAPSKFFTKFGGNGIDVGYGVKTTLDGRYIVVGSTSSSGNGNTDVYLVKVDSMGLPIWERTIGGFNNDVGRSVIQLIDSGFVIAGYSNSFGSGGYDAIMVRTDKNGNQLWLKSFGGLDWDFGYDLIQSSDGNIVMCGSTNSFGHGKLDGFIVKYDLNGNLIWQKFYGGVEDDDLKALIKTSDNLIACVGSNKSLGEINGNGYFLKLNLAGDTIFTRNFGGAYRDYATDLTQMYNGDYLVVGAKTYSANAKSHSYTIRYSSIGNFVLDQDYYNSSGDENWMAITNSFAGNKHWACIRNVPVPNFGMQCNIFVHLDYMQPYLVNSYGGFNDESIYAIDKTKDGGYVSVGTTASYGAINGDVFLMKQDSTVISYQEVIGIDEKTELKSELILKKISESEYQIDLGLSSNYSQFFITDLFGKRICSQKIEGRILEVSLDEFYDGFYILSITGEREKTVNFKLINR